MSAGGTWVVQNKKRPGAYINFVAVPKPLGSASNRGIVICALPMTWGAEGELITLFGDDLLNGKSDAKIGYGASDVEASLPYRLALAGCYKALLFRADRGGAKATYELSEGSLTVNAKYTGTTGNHISIVITKDKPSVGQHTVEILFKSVRRESFIVTTLADFDGIDSNWVDFFVDSEPTSTVIPTTAGAVLAGGSNGTVSSEVYEDFFEAAEGDTWNCLAINSTEVTVQQSIANFIKLLRDTRGKKVQGIVYDYNAADFEGIISVNQGFTTETDTVGVDLFPLFVASITAGADVNESNTAREIPGAISITNPVSEENIVDGLNAGKFLLSYRQDGAVCVEKDINTLHTFTVDKGYAFSKNRVIRCLDEIGNTVALVFSRNYCGKIDNDSIGRNLYKSEIISMMDSLVDRGAIQNFDGPSDITILPGADVDSLVVDVTIQPVDSMEKLYMTVNVDA